ncbi:MAG TPA: PAS domain-containing protein, partial [Bryobacteraceae bacterium]|nr:PAS domain-containing protein [Bryobacteraceae bacterium]
MTASADSHEPSSTDHNEIAEGVPHGLLEVDADFRLLYVNASAERFAGRARTELCGKTIWDAFPESLHTPIETALRRCAGEGVTVSSRAECAGRWYDVTMTPRRAGGVIVWFPDITERRLAEECAVAKNAAEDRLRLSEERFRVALRDSGIFVWQQDSELRYTWQYNTVGAVLE